MLGLSLVEVTDFRSFAGTHTWVLGEGPGLFFLTGENHDNERLSSNGCGKSSLLDAICWCLYGRTTRLLRGNDVINYDATSCRVRVELRLRDSIDNVIATQNPNSVTLNGITVDRKDLVKHLGLNFESFLYAIVIPQYGESFLDKTPGEKLTLFSEIMELDYWLEKSKQASTAADAIKKKIDLNKGELLRLEGQEISIGNTITDLTHKSKAWQSEQDAKRADFLSEIRKDDDTIQFLMSDMEELVKFIKDLDLEVEGIVKLIDKKQNVRDNLKKDQENINSELAVLSHEINRQKSQTKIQSDVRGRCPTCNQKVDKDHFERGIQRIKEEIKSLNKTIAEVTGLRTNIDTKLSKLNQELYELASKGNELKNEKSQVQRELDSSDIEIKFLKNKIQKAKRLIDNIKNEKNEFEAVIKSRTSDLAKVVTSTRALNTSIEKLNEEYAATYYWVAGFKQIRLNIIEETLTSLEIEVNNNLTSMGMSDWRLEFDIERETKSGGISKGFSVLIHDNKGRTVKYEALSGGEGQRVRLAGCFGLANLIMERAGLESKIEFYDELSQHLSTEGIEDMLITLHERAVTYNRQIIIVDHHSMSYADFSGTWKVIKDKNGSRIEQVHEYVFRFPTS